MPKWTIFLISSKVNNSQSKGFVLITEIFWWIFWHDNWQSLIVVVENFRFCTRSFGIRYWIRRARKFWFSPFCLLLISKDCYKDPHYYYFSATIEFNTIFAFCIFVLKLNNSDFFFRWWWRRILLHRSWNSLNRPQGPSLHRTGQPNGQPEPGWPFGHGPAGPWGPRLSRIFQYPVGSLGVPQQNQVIFGQQ